MHHAKKSLGQNFLKSEEALRTMCTAGSVSDQDIILEIGPGKGALTVKLLENAREVIAVEKDRDLVKILEERFAQEIKKGKLKLIEGDILDFEPENHKLTNSHYKIIANIPYNITGAIFKKFLSGNIKPSTMVMLVQKEVAERIVARDSKESILSLSVKVYGVPKYIMKVGKRFFSPNPKVDSAIVAIENISSKKFPEKDLENRYFEVVKAGFAHKRKVLRKNLESVANPTAIENMFTNLKLDTKIRAEDVSFTTWIEIARILR